jgi:hypothetical protein
VLRTLGSLEAPDEKTARAKAAEEFHIPPARQSKIVVTKLDMRGLNKRAPPWRRGPLFCAAWDFEYGLGLPPSSACHEQTISRRHHTGNAFPISGLAD